MASNRIPGVARAAVAVAAFAAALSAVPGPAGAAQKDGDAVPAKTVGSGPTHAWQDGGTRRALTLQSDLRADFSPSIQGKSAVLRPATGALKDVSPALQSPVFRDEGGRMRALPGGVLVVLATPLDDDAAAALIASHDARAVRRVGDRTWLVESAAGLPSLDLANRLAATGAFAAAQPNWWVERARK